MFAPPGKRHGARLGRDSPLHFLTAALSSDRLFFLEGPLRSFKRGGCMKIPAALLSVVLAGAVFAATPAVANQAATEKKEAATKQTKWQGKVVRISKDSSTIDIHGGAHPSEAQRKIMYDASTQWTNGGKPGQQDDVKTGSYIIVLGTVDGDGVLHAARIDLRAPR
jgi:Domain of unknown function (DUF5666)